MKRFLPGTLASLALLALFCLALIPNEATAAAAKDQDHKDEAHPEPNHDANHDAGHGEGAHPEGHPEPRDGKDHHDGAEGKAESEPEPEPETDHHSREEDDDHKNGASHVGIAPAFLFLPLFALLFHR